MVLSNSLLVSDHVGPYAILSHLFSAGKPCADCCNALLYVAAGVKGRTVSLKIKRRKTNAPDPPKFMGHGDCDNMSRSVTLSRFTDASSELASQGKALLRALKIDPTQIRGIGLNVSTAACVVLHPDFPDDPEAISVHGSAIDILVKSMLCRIEQTVQTQSASICTQH